MRNPMTAILAAALTVGVAGVHAAGGASARSPWLVFAASPQRGTLPDQLFRVRADGAGLRQITTGSHVASDPAFSPDGRRVAFARLGVGIFTLDLDGTPVRRLTAGCCDAFPVWSPDGRRIAFVRGSRLYTMHADGRVQRLLRRAPRPAGRPSWTPDGGSLVVPANGSVYRVDDRVGRVQKRLAVRLELSNGAVPTLSPDARTVAFVGRRPEPPGCERNECEVFALYVERVMSASRRRIAADAGPAGWSPDGRTLVYAYRGALRLRWLSGRVRTIRVGENALTGDAPPAWQPR